MKEIANKEIDRVIKSALSVATYIENGKARVTQSSRMGSYDWISFMYRDEDKDYVEIYPQISSNGGKTWDRLRHNVVYTKMGKDLLTVNIIKTKSDENSQQFKGLVRFIIIGKDKNMPFIATIIRWLKPKP